MSPRMGRPIAGSEPKNRQIALRANRNDGEKVSEVRGNYGKDKTELLEKMVDELHERLTKK